MMKIILNRLHHPPPSQSDRPIRRAAFEVSAPGGFSGTHTYTTWCVLNEYDILMDWRSRI